MFDVFNIESILSKLQSSCCSGLDLLPPVLLRRCAPSLSYPVLLICRKSLSSKHVPLDWKDANVTPLFKGGIHSNSVNYRPICLTSVCCKSFERIIVSHLSTYLESNHVVSNLSCKYCFFADDLKFYLAAPISKADFELSHYLMQRDVNKLHVTSLSWGLSFSVEKSVTVRFCRWFHNAPDSLIYFIGNQQIPVKQM